MKSFGSAFPQVLISKLKEIGMLMLMPRIFAFNAVQRQTAASRSRRPPSTEQQGWSGGFPIVVPTLPLSSLAQMPSFRASLGQVPLDGVGLGIGFGFGFVFGTVGWLQVKQPLVREKNRRLRQRKRAVDEHLESIDQNFHTAVFLVVQIHWLRRYI